MLAAVATKGDLLIKNCITKHLDSITAKIIEVGGTVEDYGDSLRVYCKERPHKANIKTLPSANDKTTPIWGCKSVGKPG